VISRTSIIQYKDVTPKRLPQLARELNVDAVVEGSIVRSGTGLRITAELIDARSDSHVWTNTYDREPNDLVGLPRDVAQAIEEAVAGKSGVRSSDRRPAAPPIDPDAYTLFFQSLVSASAGTYEGFQDAITYCRHATEKAPMFAAAYARMSLYYLQFSFFGNIAPKQFMPAAEAAARHAIDLDDSLPEAHAVLGAVLYRYRWNWSDSEKEFRRALALNQNYAEGHRMFSAFLLAAGHADEAIVEAQRAHDLDPQSVQATLNLGQAYRVAGQYDRAIELFGDGLHKDPRLARAHYQLGHAYVEKGMQRDGIAELERAVDLSHHRNAIFLSSLGYVYARAGRTGEARTILDELEALGDHQYVPPTAIARVYVGLDDKRAAHPWIEKAFLERDLDLISTHADIGLAQLRSDPDFHDIFARASLVH
jgi:tetratricopeptide (TPR) repeat protein